MLSVVSEIVIYFLVTSICIENMRLINNIYIRKPEVSDMVPNSLVVLSCRFLFVFFVLSM